MFKPVILPLFFPDIKSENFCMKALDFESVAKICRNHTNLRFFRTKRSNFVPDSERERLVVSGQLWWVVAPVPALRSSDVFLVTKNLLVFDTKLVLNHFCQRLSIWLTRC